MTLPTTRAFLTNLITSLSHPSSSDPTNLSKPSIQDSPPSKNPLKSFSKNQRAILLTLHILFPHEHLPALDLLDRELVTRFDVDTSAAEDDQDALVSGTMSETIPGTKTEKVRRAPIYHVRSAQVQKPKYQKYGGREYYHGSAGGGGGVGAGEEWLKTSSTHYEVRPLAWNCSCPAFAFSAFPGVRTPGVRTAGRGCRGGEDGADGQNGEGRGEVDADTGASAQEEDGGEADGDDDDGSEEARDDVLKAGGLALGEQVPICKHLLACVLVEATSTATTMDGRTDTTMDTTGATTETTEPKTGMFDAFVKVEKVSLEEVAGWGAGWGG